MSKIINPGWISPSTFLTYIPSTKDAVLRRGFDHAKLTAEELASLLNVKLICAFAPPSNEDQRNLGRNQRLLNISNKFMVTKDLKTTLESGFRSAILIDDVFTTGATLYSASQVLKDAGASHVFCANFSRTF
ncbi:MAG: hypothetical protein Q4F54_02445 [Coriobacteriia bacterium]|nr:hypothetical protein [Coriobacteriia bacterium]